MKIISYLAQKSGHIIFYLFYSVLVAGVLLRIFFQEWLTPVVLNIFFLIIGTYIGNWIAYKSFKYMSNEFKYTEKRECK